MKKMKRVLMLSALILIMSIFSVSAVYTYANPAISPSGSVSFIQGQTFFGFDRSMCQAGQDFTLQISPAGCSPSVVRSDLLEEQDVTVLCQISGTRLNPLIDVEAIDYISFQGEYPREVSGIGYFPARAALGQYGAQINSPLLSNLGYVTINLRRQPNESAMPDFVEGNLTAKIRYDIKNAFGVGRAVYYLPVLNDEEFQSQKSKYSFWEGRGYLQAESVDEVSGSARISVYSGASFSSPRGGELQRIQSITLHEGRTSGEIYMPGFNYCLGGMKLKLEEIEDPDTRIKLNINGNPLEFQDDEQFLEGRCRVREIERDGLVQKTDILCREDTRTSAFDLIINPKIQLRIGNSNVSAEVGDKVYTNKEGDKSVYLAYIGSQNEFDTSKENLEIYLVALPGIKSRLSNTEISALSRQIEGIKPEGVKNLASLPEELFSLYTGVGEIALKGLFFGQKLRYVKYGSGTEAFGESVSIEGFAGVENKPLSGEATNTYENAMEDYNRVIEAFSQEKYPTDSQVTVGEKSYRGAINLAEKLEQKEDVLSLCADFEQTFSEFSELGPPEICSNEYKISNQESAVRDVEINGEVHRISFEGIREPSFDEYGAVVRIRKPDGSSEPVELRKDRVIYLDEAGDEFIQLTEVVNKDRIKIRVQVNRSALGSVQEFILETEEKTLEKERPDNFGGEYLFTLLDTNIERLAKVSVNPEINYVETEAEFPFKIGIEKRNIQFTPEQTRAQIEATNKLLETLNTTQNYLGMAVKTGKALCTATSGILLAKNLFANLGGEGIARQKVMRGVNGESGWYQKCESQTNAGFYEDVEACLLDNNEGIEKDVSEYAKEIQNINSNLEDIETKIAEKGLLGQKVLDTNEFFESYVNNDYKNEITSVARSHFGNTINVYGKEVEVSEIVSNIHPSNTVLSEARDLQLNSRLLNSGSEVVRRVAASEMEAELIEIWLNSEREVQEDNLADKWGFDDAIIAYPDDAGEYAVRNPKTFGEVRHNFNNVVGGTINNTDLVYLFKKVESPTEYVLVLDRNYNVIQTYQIGDTRNLRVYRAEDRNPFRVNLRNYGDLTYKNQYDTPEIRYYESGLYEGLPAIVPFDLDNGWYAAVRSTFPAGRSIEPFEESGKVSSFYLCNVGENGRQEFSSRTSTGDDVCQLINIGIGQPYNQFPGLDENEASRVVSCAINAIASASRPGVYGKGVKSVRITTACGGVIDVKVGEAYASIPDIQCQDFMSPSDCNLLFNFCDPVVCPSSRCDLDGNFPVDNVVQSGIAGSLALCLPNWPEVKVPICLTGLHAGVEGLTTVFDSYSQCLQTGLETGQTVGICDEIKSVYMCDFLWKQGRPIANFLVQEGTGRLLGQGGSGGGEYLTAQDAFNRAGESAEFLSQYYAENSFEAFQARSVERAGTEICQSWISGAYPDIGSAFNALIEPDSPPQFHGTFEEMPFTTATNPPTSHYKVFYHIFSGRDSRANYEVYLKGTGGYFTGTAMKRVVSIGFLEAGEYITETKDFTAPSGYQEMCISVNGQEECGFQKVSTSFGVDIINDVYIKDQVERSDITSQEECVSGTRHISTLLNPNIQAGAQSLIDPQLYNQGVVRICATDDPGKGSDPNAGGEDARYVDVGYCGDENLRCWLDTESAKNVIKHAGIEEGVLDEHANRTLEALKREGNYIEDFEGFVKSLEGKQALEIINIITENLDNVFFNNQRAHLLLQRAGAFSELADNAYQEALKEKDETVSEGDLSLTGIDEIDEKIGETLGKQSEIGEFPVFELKDGRIFTGNLYYTYGGGEWVWSENPNKGWTSVEISLIREEMIQDTGGLPADVTNIGTVLDDYNDLTTENKELIRSLVNAPYSEGLGKLILRIQPRGGVFLRDPKLSVEETKVEFTSEGYFVLELEGLEKQFREGNILHGNLVYEVYFDHVQAKQWRWSPDRGKTWTSVPDIEVSFGEYEEFIPSSNLVRRLIVNLEDKSLLEGAAILFSREPGLEILQSEEGEEVIIIGETESGETGSETGTTGTEGDSDLSYFCDGEDECQKLAGERVIEIAREIKQGRDSTDSEAVFQDTGAENFECLVLQVARLESKIKHCQDVYDNRDFEGNPFYCENLPNEVLSADDEKSKGIMQINIGAHPDIGRNYGDFENNVRYGINLLIDNYEKYGAGENYRCYRPFELLNSPVRESDFVTVRYSGWEAALRGYNGWNSLCTIEEDGVLKERGNPRYVDQVIGFKDEVENLFPGECGFTQETSPGEATGIS